MTFNGPPKPTQEKPPRPVVETPEYWEANKPFKSPRKYYEVQLEFAMIMAERTGVSLVEAVDAYAPVIRNHIHTFNEEGDWEITGLEEGVTDENMLDYAWARSLERHVERNSEPTEYHPEGSRFGCHYYDYDEESKTINVHFFNAEFEEEWEDRMDVSTGPLDRSKIERRKHELKQMFEDIKARYPDAKYVNGRSSLYSLKSDAYRRLYPPTYEIGEIDYDSKLWGMGTNVWGQVLGGNDKEKGEYGFKQEIADEILEKAKTVPIDRLADALPMPPRTAHGNIQDFYDFYGIK